MYIKKAINNYWNQINQSQSHVEKSYLKLFFHRDTEEDIQIRFSEII